MRSCLKLECWCYAIAFVAMFGAPLSAAAYTQADVDACTPDAMRLCQEAIPDATRVALCLVKNKQQLGPACTIVLNRQRAASTSRERPANVEKTNF